jgi:N-acetyl sugar amidotransferase
MNKSIEQRCTRCIMDTTVPGIRFDENGVCNFCHAHDRLENRFPLGATAQPRLIRLVNSIRDIGKNRKYGCIVGVSGGRDSTYTLYLARKLELRPLAVHFDNGWNSSVAVNNLKNAVRKLDVDLHTVVADWEEFKDLQRAFLKASVSDAEVPTDYVILSVLMQTAVELDVKYVVTGQSFRTEGVAPLNWTYMDGHYIRSVHRRFGDRIITSFPILSLSHLLYYTLVKRIKYVSLPQYLDYRQKEVSTVLEKELGWKYYGGHHHESTYTSFFQSYFLPTKFGIDKRKLENSALIRSGQMTREDAIKEIEENPYPYDEKLVKSTIVKLGFSEQEFKEICDAEIKTFRDYPTYHSLIRACRLLIQIACRLNLLPLIFYEKYLR